MDGSGCTTLAFFRIWRDVLSLECYRKYICNDNAAQEMQDGRKCGRWCCTVTPILRGDRDLHNLRRRYHRRQSMSCLTEGSKSADLCASEPRPMLATRTASKMHRRWCEVDRVLAHFQTSPWRQPPQPARKRCTKQMVDALSACIGLMTLSHP